jgi:hypothetical protein
MVRKADSHVGAEACDVRRRLEADLFSNLRDPTVSLEELTALMKAIAGYDGAMKTRLALQLLAPIFVRTQVPRRRDCCGTRRRSSMRR